MITLKQLKTINQEITEFFEKVDRRGRIAGRVRRLMDRNEKYLRPKVDQWLEAMRAKIDLEVLVDPSILGGVIIRHSDKMLDNSVRGRLVRTVGRIANPENRFKR